MDQMQFQSSNLQSSPSNKLNSLKGYTVLDTLGRGAFGKVKLCTLGSERYAVKVLNKNSLRKRRDLFNNRSLVSRTALDDVQREIEILRRADHKNILKFYESMEDEENLYIVTEYCSKALLVWDDDAEVFRFDGELTQNNLNKIVRGLLSGLSYLHSCNIVHRDIKPQNILVNSNWDVRIADFGNAIQYTDNDLMTKSVGTYSFFAPECCSKQGGAYSGKAADVWALGITIYALVFRVLPFSASNICELFDAIESFKLEFPERIEDRLANLLHKLLEKDPIKRMENWDSLRCSWECNKKKEEKNWQKTIQIKIGCEKEIKVK